MLTVEELKQRACATIDQRKKEIIGYAKEILTDDFFFPLVYGGYMPLLQNQQLAGVFKSNANDLVGEDHVGYVAHRTGSTDMGDVSHLMPAIHP